MKKVLSVLLCVAMLFSVLAFNTVSADTTPTVRIITNEGSPVNGKVETYFCVRFDNFSIIEGIDVIVEAEGATITNVQTYNGLPTAVDNINSTEENYDYSDDKTSVHFVDFTAGANDNARIVFKAIAPTETASVKITGKYAQDGDTLFQVEVDPTAGSFEIKEEVKILEAEKDKPLGQPNDGETFIPQSGVYKYIEEDGKYQFATKDGSGNFDVSEGGYSYTTFKLPKEGTDDITPFGISTKLDGDAYLFGNYSEFDAENAQHGTLIFEGDWIGLKEYYIRNGYSVQECLEKIYKDVSSKVTDSTYHVTYKFNCGDNLKDTKKINVYKFPRTKYLWRDGDEGTKLEYGIRLHNVLEDTNYTSAAYCEVGNEVYISHNVKALYTGTPVEDSETPETPEEPEIIYPTMAQGNIFIDTTTGEHKVQGSENRERILTVETYNVADFESAVIANGYRANFWFYLSDGTYSHKEGYISAGTVDIAKLAGASSTKFRVVISADPNKNPFTVEMYNEDGGKGLALIKASN